MVNKRLDGVNISNIVDVFPGEGKGELSHDNEYGHGQEKRRPSTHVEGQNNKQGGGELNK